MSMNERGVVLCFRMRLRNRRHFRLGVIEARLGVMEFLPRLEENHHRFLLSFGLSVRFIMFCADSHHGHQLVTLHTTQSLKKSGCLIGVMIHRGQVATAHQFHPWPVVATVHRWGMRLTRWPARKGHLHHGEQQFSIRASQN